MKKICFVVTTPFTANGFLIDHIAELSKHYQLTLCLNLELYELSTRLKDFGVKIIHVPLERKISLWKDLKAWWILLRIFMAHQFDSVHSITPKAGLLSMSSAFFARIPIRIHTFTGQIWATRSGFLRFSFKLFDRLIVKFANFVFADSESQIRFLIKEGVCSTSGIGLLGSGSISGVSLMRFKPNPEVRQKLRHSLEAKPEECVFLFVGRLCRDKGIFDLINAFGKLATSHKEAVLWIVGPDEERIQEHLKKHLASLALKIKWMGPTFDPESYMAASDVLILPSYREGFGSVIIEAAACATPCIAYRIDGVVDAVEDRVTGHLVNLADISELTQNMKQLLLNPELRLTLGRAAKARAQERFSSVIVTRAWLEFYNDLFKLQYEY